MSKKQQYTLGGILFFLTFTLSLNEFIKSNRHSNANGDISRRDGDSRTVASFEEGFVSQKEINWEHELAKTLHESKTAGNSRIAEKPTLMDQLVFGALQGRYNVIVTHGSVRGIHLKESEVVGLGINILQLFEDYKDIFQSQSKIRLSGSDEVSETYIWTDIQGKEHSVKVSFQNATSGSASNEKLVNKIDIE